MVTTEHVAEASAEVPSRLDAKAKASGQVRYVGDVNLPNLAYVAAVRSTYPHARIVRIDTAAAAAADGVIGVYTAADVSEGSYGRGLRDAPIIARDKVRFVVEKVAAVVADIGELANPAAAPAIANAVADATGCRIRELPLKAGRIYEALTNKEGR